jgi:UDP-GlcNAc:undecaprenyl-phosphate/decaprenyl-phosphate GlcNAc-1-phosphate transferase
MFGVKIILYIALFISLILIVITSKVTQKLKLSNMWIFVGQISASLFFITVGNFEVRYINDLELGYLAIPFSLLFLIGFTNVMNIDKENKSLILLLPCVSLICLSILAFYMMGDPFELIISICTILMILFLMIYGYFSGKEYVGRTLTTSIGFIVAVLSLSFLKTNFVLIYIPLFTLAIPITIYYVILNKFTSLQSIIISTITAIFFSVLMFVVPSSYVWYFVVGLTLFLIITQMSRKYRFI